LQAINHNTWEQTLIVQSVDAVRFPVEYLAHMQFHSRTEEVDEWSGADRTSEEEVTKAEVTVY